MESAAWTALNLSINLKERIHLKFFTRLDGDTTPPDEAKACLTCSCRAHMAQNPATRPFGPVCDCQLYFPINGCIHELDPNEARTRKKNVMLGGPPNHDPMHANSSCSQFSNYKILFRPSTFKTCFTINPIDRNKTKH